MARILRLPAVIDRTGKSRTGLYDDMARGTFPRPIRLGARAAGWPEHEVEQIVAARIRGDDDSAIKKLVAKLHAARTLPQPAAA